MLYRYVIDHFKCLIVVICAVIWHSLIVRRYVMTGWGIGVLVADAGIIDQRRIVRFTCARREGIIQFCCGKRQVICASY